VHLTQKTERKIPRLFQRRQRPQKSRISAPQIMPNIGIGPTSTLTSTSTHCGDSGFQTNEHRFIFGKTSLVSRLWVVHLGKYSLWNWKTFRLF